MYRYVNKLIERENDIISQLKLLRLYKKRAGVYQYIDLFLNNAKNQEPTFYKYYEYCVAKYFYGFDVEEVKAPLTKLYMPTYLPKKIEKEVLNKNNIIDELKVLRKYKDNKYVKKFMEILLEYTLTEYELYCISKYYDGLNIKEVKQDSIKLYPLYENKKIHDNFYEYQETPWAELKIGDSIILLNGTFKNITGTIKRIGKDNLYIKVDLFGYATELEIDKQVKISKLEV